MAKEVWPSFVSCASAPGIWAGSGTIMSIGASVGSSYDAAASVIYSSGVGESCLSLSFMALSMKWCLALNDAVRLACAPRLAECFDTFPGSSAERREPWPGGF